jgi:hypothetical protein
VEKRKGKLRDEARADAVIDTREFLVNLSTKMPTILKEIFREALPACKEQSQEATLEPPTLTFNSKVVSCSADRYRRTETKKFFVKHIVNGGRKR